MALDSERDFPEFMRDRNTFLMVGGLSYAGGYLGPDDHSPFPVYVQAGPGWGRDRSKQDEDAEDVDLSGVPYLDTHPARFSEACTQEDKEKISRYVYLSMKRSPRDGGWPDKIRNEIKMNRDWNDVVRLVNQYLPEGYVLDGYRVGL